MSVYTPDERLTATDLAHQYLAHLEANGVELLSIVPDGYRVIVAIGSVRLGTDVTTSELRTMLGSFLSLRVALWTTQVGTSEVMDAVRTVIQGRSVRGAA